MARVLEQAEAGDINGASETFLHEVHTFTHVVDPPLRARSVNLAVTLYNAVAEVEYGIIQGIEPERFIEQARVVRESLLDAAVALGCGS